MRAMTLSRKLCAVLFCLFAMPVMHALADGPSGGGGGSSIALPVSVANGGTGNTTGWAARRTAIDANDQLVWANDNTSGTTLTGTGTVAQDLTFSANSGVTVNGPGMFSRAVFFSSAALATVNVPQCCGASTTYNFGQTFSISAWVQPMWGIAAAYVVVLKAYRNDTTWTSPFNTVRLNLISAVAGKIDTMDCTGAQGAGSANTVATTVNRCVVPLGVWSHVGVTHDGTNARFYVNGQLCDTVANAVTIDWNGASGGHWDVGGIATTAGASGFMGTIDDVRIANVTRATSYFQGIWATAQGISGN